MITSALQINPLGAMLSVKNFHGKLVDVYIINIPQQCGDSGNPLHPAGVLVSVIGAGARLFKEGDPVRVIDFIQAGCDMVAATHIVQALNTQPPLLLTD